MLPLTPAVAEMPQACYSASIAAQEFISRRKAEVGIDSALDEAHPVSGEFRTPSPLPMRTCS